MDAIVVLVYDMNEGKNMDDIKTPLYLVDPDKLNKNCMEFENEFRKEWGKNVIFSYSVKTNSSSEILSIIKARNWHAEVVSSYEYELVRGLGFVNENIIINGPIKSGREELFTGEGYIVNIDNNSEVMELIRLINENKINTWKTCVGLRVNFDIEKYCPEEVKTERNISRFGFCYENGDLLNAVKILKKNNIDIAGLHMHLSSKTRSTRFFQSLAQMVCRIIREFELDVKYIDIGGGFFGGRILEGMPKIADYARVITKELRRCLNPDRVKLILEPGASVVATAVDYVTSVVDIREIRGERIITLDGTLLHINPFMIKRKPIYEVTDVGVCTVDVQHLCGCTCLENDRFDILLNGKEISRQSRIIFHNVGAYTVSFNSNFIIPPPRIMINKEQC